MVEASHEKEAKAKETIQALTKEISVLSKLVDHGAGMSPNQENTMNELLRAKEVLQKELEQQQTQIVGLLNENNTLQGQIKRFTDEKRKTENDIFNLKQDISNLKKSHETEQKKKDKAEKELLDYKSKMQAKQKDIEAKDSQIMQTLQELKMCQMQLKDQTLLTQKADREAESASSENERLISELNKQNKQNQLLLSQLEQQELSIKQKEESIADLKADQQQKIKNNEKLKARRKQLEEEKELILKEKKDTLVCKAAICNTHGRNTWISSRRKLKH